MGRMILYDGPSLLTGEPIVAIATVDGNPKIGEMLCTWILLQARPPEEAIFDGGDQSICGTCKYRAQWEQSEDGTGFNPRTRTCYVRLTKDGSDGNPPADEKTPPSEIWQRWKAGKYDFPMTDPAYADWTLALEEQGVPLQYVGKHPVRIGSYGDPAAVPTYIWRELVCHAVNWTGYTHMWKPEPCPISGDWEPEMQVFCSGPCRGTGLVDRCDPLLKNYCMASVDTRREWQEAKALGWTSFIVLPTSARGTAIEAEVKAGGAILCPMTAKKPVTCKKCCLCRGNSGPSRDIYEFAHGVNMTNHDWWEA